jgi:hypothetical protein
VTEPEKRAGVGTSAEVLAEVARVLRDVERYLSEMPDRLHDVSGA